MINKRTVAALACSAGLLSGCLGSSSSSNDPVAEKIDLSQLDESRASMCDHTVPDNCLYPFPNNYFTQSDAQTPTGLRVSFDIQAMPVAEPVSVQPSQLAPQGVQTTKQTPIDPAQWNRNDGFSPGSMLLAHIPGIDLEQTGAVGIGDIEESLEPDAPILVINANTGERQLIWAEMDSNAADPDRRALIIRPAKNFKEGERYIAAIRNARDANSDLIEPQPLFRAYRDSIDTDTQVYEERRASVESIFDTLEAEGIKRGELALAWDFTIASQQSLTERLLTIRDDAFARLGGGAPTFSIDSVGVEIDGSAREGLSRSITGTFQVPNYLNQPGGPSGSTFNYTSADPDALPDVLNGSDMFTARFRCQVPETAVADFSDPASPISIARPALYGHGLFGEGPGGEFRSGNVRAMQTEHNILFCATDWVGMATEDFIAGTIHRLLADLTKLPQQLDRSQQGVLNAMFLAELIWDSGDIDPKTGKGNPFPPSINQGPDVTVGNDPHESPRNTVAARLQKSELMKSAGVVVNVCGASPCYSDDYTGISRTP